MDQKLVQQARLDEQTIMNPYAIISERMLQIGDQVDIYQIQAHMAQGGMSEIYKAYDLVNHQNVVLKLPERSLIGDPAQFERFKRELEVLTVLRHPAIVRGLDSGRYNRIPFFVAEFVEGDSLRTMISEAAPFTVEKSLKLAAGIAEGIAYCHQNGVIHRDLKPENILVTAEDQPVIIDFGLALTKGSHRVTYSNLSAVAGTPDYMAPEQIEGQRGDARTDIYALGTILFEMLSGRTPFQGDTPMAVMAQHLKGKTPRLDEIQTGVPQTLAALVMKCLQRDPEARYADMNALLADLNNLEAVDLSILTRTQSQSWLPEILQNPIVKAVLISLATMAAIVIIAMVLQFLRP